MRIKYYYQDKFGKRTAEAESMTALAKIVGESPAAVSRGVAKFNQGLPSRYGYEVVDDGADDGALENQKGHCKYCGRDVSKNSRMCSACKAKLLLVRKIIAIGKLIKEDANDRE